MRAAVYEKFSGPISIQNVPDPTPGDGGVVIRVKATGLCRIDWHGWMGHDPDISLPHVPGHELAGVVGSVGKMISLDDSSTELSDMNNFPGTGVTVVNQF